MNWALKTYVTKYSKPDIEQKVYEKRKAEKQKSQDYPSDHCKTVWSSF